MSKGKETSDRFAAYASTRVQQCRFATIFDSLKPTEKAELLEAMQRHLAPTISRALEAEWGLTVSEAVVRRHMSKRCCCVR